MKYQPPETHSHFQFERKIQQIHNGNRKFTIIKGKPPQIKTNNNTPEVKKKTKNLLSSLPIQVFNTNT